MSMALIYANAVNKRMHHGNKIKKKSVHSCPMHDDSPEYEHRRSSSREGPNRKLSEHASCLSTSASSCQSLNPTAVRSDGRHRPVQRSKTSCGDLYLKKIAEDDAIRKSSTPVMSTSSHHHHSKSKSSDPRRIAAKKSFIQKYDLEHSGKVERHSDKPDRRRSLSLDENHWKEGVSEKKDEDGAFSKMKRKFSKMMFSQS